MHDVERRFKDGLELQEGSAVLQGQTLETESLAPVLDQSMLDEENQNTLVNIPVIWFNIFIAAAVMIVLAAIYLLVIRGFNIDPMAIIKGYLDELAEIIATDFQMEFDWENDLSAGALGSIVS